MRKTFSLIIGVVISISSIAQTPDVYPSHWWVGMKMNKIQLMVHGKDISTGSAAASVNYPGVQITKVHKVESKNYLFIDLAIAPGAKPGKMKIALKGAGNPVIDFELKGRRRGNGTAFAQGLTAADFIYLIMPDRFSNGDPSNDKIAGLRDQTLNRDSIYHRHGGDLQGVINHLDYLKELGVTALWMTPVIQNDMPERTEHGYAFTNHYKIEPRLGGEKAYKHLSDELHKRGMKLVQDAVYNHVGRDHFTVTDPPMKDWLNQWPKFTQTTYKDQPIFDPYGSKKDFQHMQDGWFTTHMPDMNQKNPYTANYMIQHAIWSVEEFGVDAWRIDTYIYNDLEFMNRCNKALMDEYPKMFMFGETWVHGVPSQAYFTEHIMNTKFKSNLPGVTDFQTNMHGILPALTENFDWTAGVNKLYTTLAFDYMYKNPMNHVIFLDNHDKTRVHTYMKNDVAKTKMAFAWLLTSRGIPQMYYGGEVLMTGDTHPHDGYVRLDFPGGWEGDTKNAFTGAGLTADEKDMQQYVRTLANYRKRSSAIKSGKMMQYVPDDGLYVYFRYDNNSTVMCVMNTSDKEKVIDLTKYAERTNGFTSAMNIVDGTILNSGFKIPGKKLWVLELKK